jgi:hypothetical protein
MSEEPDSSPPPPRDPFALSPGLSIIGLFLTGLIGILVGVNEGDGVALLVSFLSFGTVAWIAFR